MNTPAVVRDLRNLQDPVGHLQDGAERMQNG
ncbi:hypothetical protein SUDANB106_00377 [Streptomyces sp. enrichment culture]|uniref:Uncharacterized protein n=1 Tax=Streptomyces radiopugnans TaxID=403935 RepID=A0A1H9FT29_9ACTN|nr:hypothetical protein SAMN05216481_107171 [Streptomyces radiopugnans]